MRKIYPLIIAFSLILVQGYAQSISGPRTIFNLNADRGTGKYTFFNFDTGKEVSPADSNSDKWDIAFSGTTILLNGGNSGPSSVTGQVLTGTSFLDQISAPASGFVEEKAIPTGSGNGWYTYYGSGPSGPHTVIPIADRLIAIKLADGRFVKLQILSYYKGAPSNVPTTGTQYKGIGRYYSFRYLIAPAGTDDWSQVLTKVVKLHTPSNTPKYFNLASGQVLTESEAENDTTWNIVFKNPTGLGQYDAFNIGIFPNSGVNGSALDSLQLLAQDFDVVNEAPVGNWKSDAPVWGAYNSSTHFINPVPNTSILAKTTMGRYAKIRIESYYDNPADNKSLGYYTFSYYFQPDSIADLTTPAELTTSIKSRQSAESVFKLYPNPYHNDGDNITVSLNNNPAGVIKIYDVLGVQVFQSEVSGAEVQLKGLQLQSGLYVVSLEDNGTLYQQRLIVK